MVIVNALLWKFIPADIIGFNQKEEIKIESDLIKRNILIWNLHYLNVKDS